MENSRPQKVFEAITQMNERIKPRIDVICHMDVSKDTRLLAAIAKLQNTSQVNIVLKNAPEGIDFPSDKIMVLKDPMIFERAIDTLQADNLLLFENEVPVEFPSLLDGEFLKDEKPEGKPRNFKDRPSVPPKKRRWKK